MVSYISFTIKYIYSKKSGKLRIYLKIRKLQMEKLRITKIIELLKNNVFK